MSNQLMMLRVLINRYHGGSHPDLSALPEDETKGISEAPVDSDDADIAIRQPWEFLLSIHYSWLYPPLDKIPDTLLPHIVASLPEGQKDKIAGHYRLDKLPQGLPDPVKHLLLDRLYSYLEIKVKTPLAFVPKQPLQDILELSKERIVDLVDCLGVYDVAKELKQIVDRNQLGKIVEALNPLQQGYLKLVIHKQQRWSSVKLGLDQWGGNKQKLQKALHLRGIMRLGKALKGQHPDFVKHFYLKLDTGRAKQIQNYFDQEETGSAIRGLVMDVKEGISYIRNHE